MSGLRGGPGAQNRPPLQRLLMLAGRGAAAAADYHRELFEKALEDHAGEPVSGLLLLYSGRICHVVESCSSTIHFIIRDYASLQNQGQSALLQDIKVLVVAHNIPTRLFPVWKVAAATSPKPHPQGSAQRQPTAELVAECLAFLLRAAASVHSFQGNSEDTSESVPTLGPELLVPADTINSLHRAEECLSPEDFLRMYLSPLQPALDSETVWPVPSRFPV